jgi:hypothetical protein
VTKGTARPQAFSIFAFSFFDFPLLNSAYKHREMRRTDLTEATMQGWARLNAAQRQRFFEAFLKAAPKPSSQS